MAGLPTNLMLGLFLMLICSSGYLFGQDTAGPELLPVPSEPLPCSTVMRYIDDALMRAHRAKAKLFVIVRARDAREGRMTATRAKYLKSFFRAKNFTYVEVFGDISDGRSNILDFYLDGEVLYSLPIRKRETMEWTHC